MYTLASVVDRTIPCADWISKLFMVCLIVFLACGGSEFTHIMGGEAALTTVYIPSFDLSTRFDLMYLFTSSLVGE